MPDLKISQMMTAASWLAADVFPVVRGLGNFKCTRDVFLSVVVGEYLILASPNSLFRLGGDDSIAINVGNAQSMNVNLVPPGLYLCQDFSSFSYQLGNGNLVFQTANSSLSVGETVGLQVKLLTMDPIYYGGPSSFHFAFNGTTSAELLASSGIDLTIGGANCSMVFFDSGQIAFLPRAGIAVTIPFETASITDWNGSPPGTYEDAFNRIAAFLNAHIGPIP